MLKRFEVTNYKNFKEKIMIDFSNVDGYQLDVYKRQSRPWNVKNWITCFPPLSQTVA